MDNIAYDLIHQFPLPPENHVWGEVSLVAHQAISSGLKMLNHFLQAKNIQNNVCLDEKGADFNQPIGVYNCVHDLDSQVF